MKLRTAVRLYGWLMVLGAAIVAAGIFLFDSLIVGLAGCGVCLVAILVVESYIKCPKCGAWLRMKYGLPDKCPRCGTDLKQAMREQDAEGKN